MATLDYKRIPVEIYFSPSDEAMAEVVAEVNAAGEGAVLHASLQIPAGAGQFSISPYPGIADIGLRSHM
jgi:hypothetical protein